MKKRHFLSTLAGATAATAFSAESKTRERPLMRDFIGLNGHTVLFRPKLYAPVARLVRDFHPVDWDTGKQTGELPPFPFARNRVDWSKVYGSWKAEGLRTNACLIFDTMKPEAWTDPARDARAYGEAFARAFGPGSSLPLVESVEIGNEPSKYTDEQYAKIFAAMAAGLRAGDPKLRIATCAANLGKSGKYSKSVDLFREHSALFDVVNIHQYAELDAWPTWRRSYPEDPATHFLENIGHVLKWRAEHAADKEVWLTEFGWDAATMSTPPKGDFAKWIGNATETQQAQWIVRAWLALAATDLDRAYLFFFNDDDESQMHAASGITRRFEPKPSYHACAWLQQTLGEFRYRRTLRADEIWALEFSHADKGSTALAVWRPDGKETPAEIPCQRPPANVSQMPLAAAAAPTPPHEWTDGKLRLTVGPSPIIARQ